MARGKEQICVSLNRLIRLCRDSERGFLVTAENVKNRGLKAMLKTCAVERAEFAMELQEALHRRGGKLDGSGSFPATVHRGWIDLKAAMTIGAQSTENVVLAESLRGERVALQTYERELEQDLPQETETLIRRQYERVHAVHDEIARLRGTHDERLVVRLFDRSEDVEQARRALVQAGFDESTIETAPVEETLRVHQGKARRSTVGETVLASTLLGLAVGAGLGLVVGVSMFLSSVMTAGFSVMPITRTLIAVGIGAAIGGGIMSQFGLLIGAGISEEDAFLYQDGVEHGLILMRVSTTPDRATEASLLMHGVNAGSRAGLAVAS